MNSTLAILLGAALATAIGPARATATEPLREESQTNVDATGLVRLTVENGRGLTRVMPSPDGRLHISALKEVRARTAERRRELARETTVKLAREDGVYRVEVTYPRKIEVHVGFWDIFKSETWEDDLVPRVNVKLLIQAPPGMQFHLGTASGDLESLGLSGPQRLQASSGDVLVEGARGGVAIRVSSGDVSAHDVSTATIESSSGDIEVEGSRGRLSISTSSGDVSVNDAADTVRVRTSSGDITVDGSPRATRISTSSGEVSLARAAGGLDIASTSGGVAARVTGPLREARLESNSGEIRLELPPAAHGELDVGTSSGDIRCDLRIEILTSNRNALTGRFGKGGTPIRIRTGSGDVVVTGGGR